MNISYHNSDDVCSSHVSAIHCLLMSVSSLHLSPGQTLNHLCIVLSSAALHAVCSTVITLQALSNWQLQ